ncbi:hypothetical protein D1AOALGA4SA_6883 [Olavius algarvensis Delta 1 endosymbiont]|nr:hypothetical protein D1AOALGA4SA_6883 [Olavius algarvensis Delta 1 endosymbiont]
MFSSDTGSLNKKFCCIINDVSAPTYKITNYKHQITNKSQNPITNDRNDEFGILNFGYCYLFVI